MVPPILVVKSKIFLNKPLDFFENKAYIKECTAYFLKYCFYKEELRLWNIHF